MPVGSADPVLLLNRGEAAQRLRISERTVRHYGAAGLMDGVKVGVRLVKVTAESVERLIRDGSCEVVGDG